ncbi:MAG TPA: neutral/alkaline non-lysosomal ceramidase N-terminal domain-containing protein [Gemmataceae bacterium]|nr:neutral/alkaline non-lysosomal ceramidase N-terminal domain-containing protein [Gemmataceae bacterium]
MRSLGVALGVFCVVAVGSCPAADFKAGVATRVITPPGPLWMAGYGSRDHPASEKLHDLHVKALALEDAGGGRLVLLTSDLVGIPHDLSHEVADEVHRRTGLPRERLMLTCSHTHCGPVVNGSLIDMYDMPPEEAKKIGPYTDRLRDWMVEAIVGALHDLKPARLAVGKGTARFAVNRRQPTPKGVINGYNPGGPVDDDVPVLRVEAADGTLRAVVFGYACHNTTMQFYKWSGDYAGFAQIDLEKKHPGAVALFWIGCGADANPLPRSKLELCEKYGRELADAVEAVLGGPMTPVSGPFTARYETIALPLGALPSKQQWKAEMLSKQVAVRRRAARMLHALENGGKIADHYRDYPVQVWRLGGEVLWVALGGEVVVDYDLRLKKELAGGPTVWVTGYANDVMAYIPSRRVLREGGYEADSSMIYYGLPTKWSPAIEDLIVGKVHDLVR